MHNPVDDNELDYLSREAAGRYDTPGEANWQKVLEELNRVLPVQPQKRRTAFLWWALPALLLGGTGYWLLENKQEVQTPILKTVPVTGAATNNDKSSPKENTVAVPAAKAIEKNVVADAGVEKVIPAEVNSSNQGISLQKAGKRSSRVTDHFTVTNKPVPSPAQAKAITNPQIFNSAEPMAGKTVTTDTRSNTGSTKETTVVNSDTQVATNISAGSLIPGKAADAETITSAPVSKKELLTVSKGKGWSYALLAGVDKSTVKFRYGNNPGFNLGVLAGYHFNNRLSIHTGGIYTQKNYKLAGEDFTAPKGSWISYYKLENVEGYCRMWEVPLLLRYTVSNHGKNSVYLSTGLSSYFMTKENYNYFFYSAGQPVTRNTGYPSSDTHILSIAHFSVGFENQVSKTLSLQIEPYAKLPLDGIGLGNISLSSFGLNFSLQHRQPSKK